MPFNLGPLYTYISDELSLQLTSLHRQLFYWIVGAVALHILAVISHVIFKRDNIINAMFTGKKNVRPNEEANLQAADKISINSSKKGLAVTLIIVLSALLAAVILTAPEAIITTEY